MQMLTLCFCVLLIFLESPETAVCSGGYSRADFPADFIFGAGTSAYQVEGAAFEDGRTPNIWDAFTHEGRLNGATGDIACDQYHKYKEDVQLMVEMGLNAYRFSISWTRLIPSGKGPVNPKGLAYYNNLINELVAHGIQPHVTLLHSDTPQSLEDEYGGWLSPKIVKDFTSYANVCFREFGDRVSHWTTFNEGNMFVWTGYDMGIMPPERCSPSLGWANCTKGNSSTEPYIATHNILLAHASAVRLYKRKYQDKQHGLIGFNIFGMGFIPLTNTTEDAIATQRANDFYHGWFLDPLVFGDYPDIMKKNAGVRLPTFTANESKQVRGSFDFLAINHYIALHVKDNPSSLNTDLRSYSEDAGVYLIYVQGDPPNQYRIEPWGLQVVLEHLKQVYGNPPIYIHENGQRMKRNVSLDDTSRVNYLHDYVGALLDSVRNGSNARGYFMWSLLDVFELVDGYESGYGLYYVDLDDPNLRRYPKLSAHWYSTFLKGGNISLDGIGELKKNLSGHLKGSFSS